MSNDGYLSEIQSIEDIQALVRTGFTDWKRYGEVNMRAFGDLILFNYSTMAQYANRWNYFEQVSRGLILNRSTTEIVARPFDKFFNWLEGGRTSDGTIVSATEKVDGSLGILYRMDGKYRVATRGSFEGDQALWATEFLNVHHDLAGLPDDLTLLFEIVYPENKIVVNYGERQELVLLAARNRHTGAYLSFYPDVQQLAKQYGFPTPTVHQFSDLKEIFAQQRQIDISTEGYVIEFSDGQRFKFKGERYMELQKLIVGLTFKNVLIAMSSNAIQQIYDNVPDEYLGEVREWVAYIEATIADVQAQVQGVYTQAPKDTRRDFAIWVNANHPTLSSYLFSTFSGYDIVPMIYKLADWSKYTGSGEVEAE